MQKSVLQLLHRIQYTNSREHGSLHAITDLLIEGDGVNRISDGLTILLVPTGEGLQFMSFQVLNVFGSLLVRSMAHSNLVCP